MDSGFQGGNPILKPLKWYKELHLQKHRLSRNLFIAEGPRVVNQICAGARQNVVEILATAKEHIPPDIPARVRILEEKQFTSISTAKNPQSPLAVVQIPANTRSSAVPPGDALRILLMENIQDPGNTGTLIRTAVALGFSGIVMSDKCADPFSPRVVQASAGTLLSVWIRRTPGYRAIANNLADNGYTFYAAAPQGTSCTGIRVQSPCIVAVGNEGNGLSPEIISRADQVIAVPINSSRAESLNVAAAGAILMYVFRLK
ncbi:MAG: hypothetical protein GF350_00440 [Chitinivibrionales bacterium]|nr:hypothetical protein [Chitinivibrionales bacterium]